MKFSCIFVITFWCSLFIYEKSTAMKDENFVIQTDNEGINDNIEKNTETGTIDMEKNDVNPISGDENLVIQPSDEAFNVNSEKNAEMVSSDVQRKGKKSKSIRNCLDLKKQGKRSGTYLITPCDDTPTKVVKVYCDMDTDRGGWTVIQRRDNYIQQQEFNNTWLGYALGFGDVSKDFWLGNDNIHCLTEQSQNEIRFDIEFWNSNKYFANYGFFYVNDRNNKYKMEVQNFTGNYYDRFTYHSNRSFTTFDSDNDQNNGNCATYYGYGGWWYGSCFHSFLNGRYNSTIYWYNTGIKMTEMKLRPRY